jgi:chloramphenicol O-acetyltransferase type A
MKQKIDLATWNRKEHFEFFSTFEEPFFGITTPIDIDRKSVV